MIIILVLAGVLSIPEDVVEAAKIDGATDMQINMKIRLPLIRTIIGTCEILAATSMLREFELTSSSIRSLPIKRRRRS